MPPGSTLAGDAIERSLHDGGHMWSTMVTVARAAALWDLIVDAQPELHRPFERIRQALGTSDEAAAIRQAYEDVPSASLSKGVFERAPARLGAVTVRDVYWSDWGCEERVRETWHGLAGNAPGGPLDENRFCVDWAVTDPPAPTLLAARAQQGLDASSGSAEVSP